MKNFKQLAAVAAVIVIIALVVATFLNDGWKNYLDIALCSAQSQVHVEPQFHIHTGGMGACP